MIKAYVMTSMSPGTHTKAFDEIKKIPNIEKISIVTGDYDIVVKVHVNRLEDLYKLINHLHEIKGIEKTITSVITKEIILTNREKHNSVPTTYHQPIDFTANCLSQPI